MKYIIYASETVVVNDTGRKVVSCPTELEAVEFIAEQEAEVCEY